MSTYRNQLKHNCLYRIESDRKSSMGLPFLLNLALHDGLEEKGEFFESSSLGPQKPNIWRKTSFIVLFWELVQGIAKSNVCTKIEEIGQICGL